ncbi:MAG: GNAT family N-acetyltransferase, partial [Bacteroidota bacterium]
TYTDRDTLIALPLVLRPIPGTEWFDFTSVYGYVGPLMHIDQDTFDHSHFKQELLEYLKSKHIVSLFSRLHPYFEQSPILEGMGTAETLGDVVNIDVTLPVEESRRAYGKSNKNQINKLRRECSIVKAETEADILEFVDIYYENMDRLNADSSYYFSKDYFLNFMKIDSFKTDILLVKENSTERYIAGSMFVKTSGFIVQYHLSGTRTDYLRMKPSKLFLDEMRHIATQEGYTFFNLGGGLGSRNDSLFEFKASFSKDFKPFKVWKFIVDESAYNTLITKDIENSYFPKYRAK